MSNSLSKATTGLVTYTVSIDGKSLKTSYAITEIEVFKGVNRISWAKISVADGGTTSDSDFSVSNSSDFDPGKEVEIKAGYNSQEETIFKGIIIKHSLRMSKTTSFLQVECRDNAVAMTIGRKNAVFAEKKDSDIISEIIGTYSGIDKQIEDTSFEYPEMVQHYATDWDFILTRADANGLIVTVDDGAVKIAAPNLGSGSVIDIVYGSDVISFHGEVDSRTQLKTVNAVAWDMANQAVITSESNSTEENGQGSLKSVDLAKVLGLEKYTLQSSANIPLGVLDAWTAARHLKSSLAKVKARLLVNGVANIKPADIVGLQGLSDQFNGNAFVGGVSHKIEDGKWTLEIQIGFSQEWYAEETPNIDAAPASAMYPPIKGLQTAIVKQIHEDADGQYRVKVALPTLEKDNLTVWARLSNFYATKEAGLFFYPEIDDEVIVGFLNEDPQNPIILGSVYSSGVKPAYTPTEDNFIKGLVTKEQLKVEFDDEKKIITIITPAENQIVLNDEDAKITLMDSNGNTVEMSEDGILLDSAADINIKASGDIVAEAGGDIKIKATGDVKTEGVNVENKGSAKFAAEGAMAELKGSGQTTIEGGIVMIN